MWQRRELLGLGVGACLSGALAGWPAAAARAAGNEASDGAQLAQALYDRPSGQDATSRVEMALSAPGKSTRLRKMVLFRREGEAGATASMIRFIEPADIDGTGLLTLTDADGETDQWIYLPAMRRVRRVDSSRQGGRFVNSDYYFEDLRERKPSKDAHRILGAETVAGVSCQVLESVPLDPESSVYVRRVAWVDPQRLLALRVDLYEDGPDQPTKRLTAGRIEKVQGFWSVMDSTMTDLTDESQTRLQVEKMVYDQGLPESLFSSRALSQERRDRQYRP
ncbi:outer membrane lipoprotein-sorting protein [Hydrogenophaga sp. 5NK40-0174]